MSFPRCAVLFAGVLMGTTVVLQAATLPAGFVEEPVASGWQEAVGLAIGPPDDRGVTRTYVWERAGQVWIVENGVKLATPLLDIREEVGGWRDYGLLGFALDPHFQTNGHFYVLYVVDRHHLLKFGTPAYNAATNEYFAATIGRVARFTARRDDDFRTADPASRKILIGETRAEGFPILHHSHGTGSLVFGTDGTLLASCGDGASYESVDNGGTAGHSYGPQALADGIITPAENIGAFRCQLLGSMSGKIVRIDPATGDGLPSNPWYQSGAPRSTRSRVWAYGLRNPLRMSLKPDTGQHDPAAGAPGALFIGDVGWNSAEDLEVADGPGKNFGWPLYEGYRRNTRYWNVRPAGMNATDWLRPLASWRGFASVLTAGGAVQRFGVEGTAATGGNFSGNCSVGGVWFTGNDFPAEWRNVYFHADYGGQWIRAFTIDANHVVTAQRPFLTGAAVTCLATHPVTGGLYYVTWGGGVKKISYAPTGNRAPTAVATASPGHGSSPMAVAFSSVGSSDPENGEMSFAWDFGDGTSSTEPHPVKTFTASGAQAFVVTLTVRDSTNATAAARTIVTVNNPGPTVVVTSPAVGATFPITGSPATVLLTATVTSPGHSPSSLSYRWQSFLHHNSHVHSEAEQTTALGSLVVNPLAPGATDYFYYRVVVTVTDPLGAQSTVERFLLPADTAPGAPPFATLGSPPPIVGATFSIPVRWNEPVSGLSATDFEITNGAATALVGSGAEYTLSVTPAATGPVRISLPSGTCLDSEELPNAASVPASTFMLAVPPAPPPIAGRPGLKAEYFSGEDFAAPALTRLDPNLAFYWPEAASPGPGVPGDYFSARWTGQLTVPTTGSWQFFVDVDDGLRLWVNGQLVLDHWKPTPAVYWGLVSTPITLTAGVPHDFKLEYQDFFSDAYLMFRWAGPETPPQIVPASAFSHPGEPPPPPSGGPGLTGEYFSGETFATPALTRVDPSVTFYWPETTSPGPGVPGDYFSARWTGQLTVPTTGSWQFFADVDDGLRLWVNDQLLLDHWNPTPATYWGLASTPITLTEGEPHAFKLEYQDFFSDAYLKLRWAGPGNAQQAVPASAFAQPTNDATTTLASTAGTRESENQWETLTAFDPIAPFLAARADLPRLALSVEITPQPDGTISLQFTRLPALRLAVVLQASDDMHLWHDIPNPGWPVTTQPDGTEQVTVPNACCLLAGHQGTTSFFRFRVGP